MKKILIIDDENSIRETIADILEIEGYHQKQAANGREGIQIARAYLPDLILCDVKMPELDGYGVLAELQKTPFTERIPFIFLTAQATHHDIRRGMSFGADDYITKPFTAADLLNAIEKRLQKFDLLKNARLEEIDQIRNYLNTTLPHELRTPLTGLMGYIDWLLTDFDDIEPDQIKDVLARMNKSANRLYRLIENHLLHAQLDSALKETDIHEQLLRFGGCESAEAVVSTTAQRIAYKRGRSTNLSVVVDPATVAIFSDHLQKIIEELVDNACKFSPADSPIRISAKCTGGNYTINIRDHGRGMEQTHINQIGPNRQFDREKHEQQGNGLGLTIVMQILQIYGGNLTITSDQEKGTAIVITLPLMTETTAV